MMPSGTLSWDHIARDQIWPRSCARSRMTALGIPILIALSVQDWPCKILREFHNTCYAIIVCSRKVKVSYFRKVGMSHSPDLNDTGEIADGIDHDERARFAADRGFVESR